MSNEAELIIKILELTPHPEGGYYKEIYRSNEIINFQDSDRRIGGSRNFSTSIYFLLAGEEISHFHRLTSDEIWHFYKGSPLLIHLIEGDKYSSVEIGNNIESEVPQLVIRKGIWFAAELMDKTGFSLVGCTVSPGFDFKDFELAEKDELIKIIPSQKKLIEKFTIK